MIEAALFILGFAALNRFCGGGFEKPQGPLPDLPGRAIWYAGLLLLVVLPWLYGWPGLVVALAFIAYREPGWRVVFGAELDWRRTDKPRQRMFLRSLFALPLIAIWPWGAIGLVGFALMAVLAYEVGNRAMNRWPSENRLMQFAEPLAGAAFGLTAWILLAGEMV
jgi:hypothetical protein